MRVYTWLLCAPPDGLRSLSIARHIVGQPEVLGCLSCNKCAFCPSLCALVICAFAEFQDRRPEIFIAAGCACSGGRSPDSSGSENLLCARRAALASPMRGSSDLSGSELRRAISTAGPRIRSPVSWEPYDDTGTGAATCRVEGFSSQSIAMSSCFRLSYAREACQKASRLCFKLPCATDAGAIRLSRCSLAASSRRAAAGVGRAKRRQALS